MIAAIATAAIVVLGGAAIAPSPPARRPTGRAEPTAGARPDPARSRRARRTAIVVDAVVTVAAVTTIGPVGAAAVLGGAMSWRRLRPIAAQRRHRRQVERDLPDSFDVFVMLVHAGLTPRQSIERLARHAPPSVRPGFREVVAQLERGRPLGDALLALRRCLGSSTTTFVDLLAATDRYGQPLAPVLQQLTADSRARLRRLDEAAARTLPVKLAFPLVVCTLPSFVLLAIVPAVLAALSSLGDSAW